MLRLILLTSLVALSPSPAAADQTVVYKGDDGRDLVMEIADSGSVRIEGLEKDQSAIIEGGVLYLVGTEKGAPRVMRINDVAAAMEQAIGPLFKGLFEAMAANAPTKNDLVIERAGTRSVGGRAGDVYRIKGLDDASKGEAVDWVVSKDQALAPVGAAMHKFLEATLVMAAPFLGAIATDMVGDMRQVFALGTPLKVAGKFELASVKDGPIDPARFKLPAAPVSIDEIVKEMKANTAPQ